MLSGATDADLDDDTGVGTIQPVTGSALSIADASGPENAVMKFDVTLSPAASQTVTVDYATKQRTVPGAATAGSDYQSKSRARSRSRPATPPRPSTWPSRTTPSTSTTRRSWWS